MHGRSHLLCILVLVFALVLLAGSAECQEWPQYRGPDSNGRSLGNGVLDREVFGLAVTWKRPLGSGYSGIVVAEGRGVTMYTDGTDDLLAAFDPDTGKELWQYPIAEMYAGHSGSHDGPLSTPTIAGGMVYALGPRGQLIAVNLADGREVWTHTLGETDARTPGYGFTTSPLVVADLVVVQTGGPDGHSISAYDRSNGKLRWSVEDDNVNYQSPAVLELAGKRQVVAVNDKYLAGIDPESGKILWKHEHKTLAAEAFAQPQLIGDNRLLLNSLREVVAVQVTPAGDTVEVSELWRSDALRRSYALPVLHEGYLYGVNNERFVTCIDAATGEKVWQSRPPGTQGLIIADGRLVMLGRRGEVVVAAPNPEGFQELCRLPVFETGGLTLPSFAGGKIYVRNLSEMAAIEVTDTPVEAAEVERELLGDFGKVVARVEAADDPAAAIEEYLAEQESFPIVEGEGLVHFVYQGEVKDISLNGNFLPFREEEAMDRIAGTDVSFKSLRLDPEVVWDYFFRLDFERTSADPRNPHPTRSFFGPASVLRMPRSDVPLEIEEAPEEQQGRVDSFQFRSEIRENERRIQLYLPAEYTRSPEKRYPLLLVTYGSGTLEYGYLNRWLDRLIADGKMAPVIALCYEEQGGQEYTGEATEGHMRMLMEELLPLVDKHYRTVTDPGTRGYLGLLDGAGFGLYVALKNPGSFGKMTIQSLLMFPPLTEEVPALIAASQGEPLQLIVEQRRHELEIVGLDVQGTILETIEALQQAGHTIELREVPGSWGWTSWRASYGLFMERMFPPPPEE